MRVCVCVCVHTHDCMCMCKVRCVGMECDRQVIEQCHMTIFGEGD